MGECSQVPSGVGYNCGGVRRGRACPEPKGDYESGIR